MKIGGDTVQIDKKIRVCYSLLLGVGYALVHWLFNLVNSEPIRVAPLIFQVVFFSGFWYLFAFGITYKKQRVMDNFATDLSIAFYGVAHQLIKTSGVSGVLYATEGQLIFQPNKKDWIENSSAVDWENITDIQTYSFLGLVDQGLIIQTKGGMKFKFQVNQPQVWLQNLSSKIEVKHVL